MQRRNYTCPDIDPITNDIVGNLMKEKDTSNNESEDAGPSNTEDWVVQSQEALLNIETLEKYLSH